MTSVLSDILPLAIGVLLSPLPVVAVILMLFGARAHSTGPAFVGGWIAGLVAVEALVVLVGSAGEAGSGESARWASALQLLLGVGLLFLAYRSWEKRPREGESPSAPKWMQAVDAFTPLKAAGLGALLSGVNPKNLLLNAGAATAVAKAALPAGQTVAALAVFAVIATIGVAVPVVYYLVGGEDAVSTLDGWKRWLAANNAIVMAVLLLILGVKLFAEGLAALVG